MDWHHSIPPEDAMMAVPNMHAEDDWFHNVHEEVRSGGPSKRWTYFMEQKGWANGIGRNSMWDF